MKTSPNSTRPSECCFAKPSCALAITRWRFATLRRPAAFLLLQRAKGRGGRNARSTSRASAFLEVSLRPIPLRESPVTAGFAAIIRPSQELSRFAAHTLHHFYAARNTKNAHRCAEPVDAETSLWKPEEI